MSQLRLKKHFSGFDFGLFPSRKMLALSRLDDPVCTTIYSYQEWVKKGKIHTFPKDSRDKWNANSLIQGLNSTYRVHFPKWYG